MIEGVLQYTGRGKKQIMKNLFAGTDARHNRKKK